MNTERKLARALILVVLINGGPSAAEVFRDHLGEELGCKDDPQVNPYCTVQEMRDLAYEQYLLNQRAHEIQAIEVSEKLSKKIGLSAGSIPGMFVLDPIFVGQSIEVSRCDNEKTELESCILEKVRQNTEKMREALGMPPMISIVPPGSGPSFQQQIETDQLLTARATAKADAIHSEYSLEWERTRALLASPEDPEEVNPHFGWKFSDPDTWWAGRERTCDKDLECLVERPEKLDELIEYRKEAQREAEERNSKAVAELQRQSRQQELMRTKELKRKREREARLKELAQIDINAIFPPNSKLRPLLDEGFEAFDTRVVIPFATEIARGMDNFAAFVPFLDLPSFKAGALENRKNLIVAAYAISRKDVLGYCGEDKVVIYRREIPTTVHRNLMGKILRVDEGRKVYVSVPLPFAEFVRNSHFEDEAGRFLKQEVEALETCENPVRRILEKNLISYATGGDFLRWDPKDPRMLEWWLQ